MDTTDMDNRFTEQCGGEEFLRRISKRIYENALPVHVKKGGILIQKGEKTQYAYYVISGAMYVRSEFLDGNIYQFSVLKKGSIVSDIEVLSGTFINAATLVVAEDVSALRIPVKLFAEELKTNIDFLYYVSSQIASKMHASSYDRGQNLFKRGIQKTVIYLISSYEKDEDENEIVKIKKTRPVIASEIGISVETLNRAVKFLKNQNQITIIKGKITINETQFQGLIDFAEKDALY
jgi:CRP-like cAMP-binding protein